MGASDLPVQNNFPPDTTGQGQEVPKDKEGTDAEANGDTGGNGEEAPEVMPMEKAGLDAPDEQSPAMNASGLPELPSHTDAKGDFVVNDGSACRGDKEPGQDGILNSRPSIAIDASHSSPLALASVAPVNASAAYAADVLSTTNNKPALSASPSTNRLPVLVASPSQHPSARTSPAISTSSLLPSDECVPAYLAPAILVHLRGVSSARVWQDLITGFLQFERAGPPSGVSANLTRMC